MVEASLGHGRKEPAPGELAIARVARRSLVAARSIGAGTVLTEELIAVMRPGTGLPPERLPELIGRRLKVAVEAGALLTMEQLS